MQVGQSGQRRVDLDAAPRPAAAARVRPGVEQVQRRRHVRRLHPREGVAVERQPLAVDERAAQAGAGREHQHGRARVAAHALRLGDAAHVAVVADDERHGTAGALGERARVGGVHVEPGEALRQVRRLVEHAVALIRTGDRQAHAADLFPVEPVLREVLANRV